MTEEEFTAAESTLSILHGQIATFDRRESAEIYELADKLRQLVKVYQASAKLAMMIVNLETAISEGQ